MPVDRSYGGLGPGDPTRLDELRDADPFDFLDGSRTLLGIF